MISSRVPAGGPGNRPSGVTDDEALSFKRLAPLDPDAIGAGDEHRVAVRRRHREDIGHRLAAFRLPGNRHPIGRHADDVGALQCAEPIRFGKPAVVANRYADAADRRLKHRKAEIAGFEVAAPPRSTNAPCETYRYSRQGRSRPRYCKGLAPARSHMPATRWRRWRAAHAIHAATVGPAGISSAIANASSRLANM